MRDKNDIMYLPSSKITLINMETASLNPIEMADFQKTAVDMYSEQLNLLNCNCQKFNILTENQGCYLVH